MSADVARIEPAPADVAMPAGGESAALISMIERAARDPNVDIDKLERLFQMHASVEARRARAAYIAALAQMQPELPIVDKRGQIDRTSKGERAKPTKFARWEDVVEAINPILAKHGFSLSFRIKQDQRVEVTAVLGHRGGHCEETSMSLPIDDSGAKNNMQGWGSSISYGKRYTASALLNIVARGEDDDAATTSAKPVEYATLADITKLIEDAKADRGWFLEHYSVETLDDLNGPQRNEIKAKLTARLNHMRRQADARR